MNNKLTDNKMVSRIENVSTKLTQQQQTQKIDALSQH